MEVDLLPACVVDDSDDVLRHYFRKHLAKRLSRGSTNPDRITVQHLGAWLSAWRLKLESLCLAHLG